MKTFFCIILVFIFVNIFFKQVAFSQDFVEEIQSPTSYFLPTFENEFNLENLEEENDQNKGELKLKANDGDFPALTPSNNLNNDYLNYYEPQGRPKVAYTKGIKNRFGSRLNLYINMQSKPLNEQTKWTSIMSELIRIAKRNSPTEKKWFLIDPDQAKKDSILFEKKGIVQIIGAWSIAVIGTATRHGFEKTPCAEFMSEVIRQAYKRAGYSHFDDFNKANGNLLNYQNGAAAVVNLSKFLNKAGWVPWDPQEYIPLTGAIMMHAEGKSPGHSYLSAGDNGRFIIDNGTPEGRDLGIATDGVVPMMFQHGIFFLPPGIIPKKW